MKRAIIIFVVIVININVFAQNSFELLIDYDNAQRNTSVAIDNNGDYITSALEFSIDNQYNSLLIKISSTGEVLKTIFFNEVDIRESIFDIINIGNNEFITIGQIYNETLNEKYLWLMKIDNELNIIWDKKELINGQIQRVNSKFNSKNNIILYGGLRNDINLYNTFCCEIDRNGEVITNKYSDNYSSFVSIYDIIEKNHSNEYYAFAITQSSIIQTLDSNYNIINEVNSQININSSNCFWISDTTYILSGRIEDEVNSDNYDLVLTVNDTLHNTLYTYIDKHDEYDFLAFWDNLSFLTNNSIYLVGTNNVSFNPYETVPSNIIISNINDTLGLKWQRLIGGDYYYNATNVIATKDGGCFIAATRTDVNNQNDYDMYFLKLDANGNFTNIENPDLKVSELILFPNPATDQINIRLGAHLHDVTLEIYDISGKKISSQNLENTETQIDISNFQPGTYIYKCYNSEREIETGKFVKE